MKEKERSRQEGVKFINPLEQQAREGEISFDFEQGDIDDDETDLASAEIDLASAEANVAAAVQAQKLQQFMQQAEADTEFGLASAADLDEDAEREKHRRECLGLRHPFTAASQVYDLFQSVLLGYIVWVTPWRIAWDSFPKPSEPIYWFDIFVDLCICFDMGLSMRRYFYNDNGELETSGAKIRSNYLKSWFLIDALSVIPFEFIVKTLYDEDNPSAEGTKITRLARLGRFGRLARIGNTRKVISLVSRKLKEIGLRAAGLELFGRILFLTALNVLCCHVIGCLWIYQAHEQMKQGEMDVWYADEYRGLFVEYDANNDSKVSNMEIAAAVAGKPVADWPHPGDHQQQAFVTGAYFCMLTIGAVGYGDLSANSSEERFWCAVMIILGTFAFAYIVGAFSSALNAMAQDKNEIDSELKTIATFLRSIEAPLKLHDQITEFFNWKFSGNTKFVEVEILDSLPSAIRADFLLHKYRKTIRAVPFFRGCHRDALVSIVGTMQEYTVLASEFLYHDGDPYVDLIFLINGRMSSVEEKTMTMIGEEHRAGSYFGEHEFLGFDVCRAGSIRARTFCEVASLHPVDLKPVLAQHIPLRRKFEAYIKLKSQLQQKIDNVDFSQSRSRSRSPGSSGDGPSNKPTVSPALKNTLIECKKAAASDPTKQTKKAYEAAKQAYQEATEAAAQTTEYTDILEALKTGLNQENEADRIACRKAFKVVADKSAEAAAAAGQNGRLNREGIFECTSMLLHEQAAARAAAGGTAAKKDKMREELKMWEMNEAMMSMDTDGSGYVDIDEFTHWSVPPPPHLVCAARSACSRSCSCAANSRW